MKIVASLRNLVVWFAVVILSAVGAFTYAEFVGRPSMDPGAEDNHLPELYEKIRLGMSYPEVLAILGHPNVVVGQKIGAAGTRHWGDKQHRLKIVIPNDDRVVSKELSDHVKVIARHP